MIKEIKFTNEAKELIKKGIDKLANTVKVTLGPKGRVVVISNKNYEPIVSKDGVTVAKEIFLKDEFENVGAKLVKEVASKTNDVAGDGTTTATVLAQALINEGLKNIIAGADPVSIKRGIEKGVEVVIKELKINISEQVSNDAEIENIASISANSLKLGKLIANAIKKVGKNGSVTVEESQEIGIKKEMVEGIKLEHGLASPYFITDQNKATAIIENPRILITTKKLKSADDLKDILEKLLQINEKNIVIIADDIMGTALTTLILNKIKGILNVAAVVAPSFNENKLNLLRDIAVVTGSNVISNEIGLDMDSVRLEDLGSARKVVINQNETTFIEGEGDKEEIKKQIKILEKQLKNTFEKDEKERIEERLAKLSNGVALIKVGAVTETETQEIKYRIEDSIHATRAAIEEGIVPGGGAAFLSAIKILDNLKLKNSDEEIGIKILKNALCEPIKQIASNAGKDGNVILNKVLELPQKEGYNANTDEFVDLFEAGIIDPTKVVRSALQNAASIAGLILTTEAMVVETSEEEENYEQGNSKR